MYTYIYTYIYIHVVYRLNEYACIYVDMCAYINSYTYAHELSQTCGGANQHAHLYEFISIYVLAYMHMDVIYITYT